MPVFKQSADSDGNRRFDEVFREFFGDGSAGTGGSPFDPGLDEAAKKDAQRKAFEQMIEEAYGGGKRGGSSRKGLLVAVLVACLIAVVVFAGLLPGGGKRNGNRRPANMPDRARLERLAREWARMEQQNRARTQAQARAAQASAQARQRVEEATRRINELQRRSGGADISVAVEANGYRLIVPLLFGWRTAPNPPASEDGYCSIMAFSPTGKGGETEVLYVVSGPSGERAESPPEEGDPLVGVKAAFAESEIIEVGQGVLTVVAADSGGEGNRRRLHSFLVVNGGVVRLSAVNVPPSVGTVESELRTLRQWRAAFGRVNPPAN